MPQSSGDRGGGARLRVVTLVDSLGLAGGGERLARLIASGLDGERYESTLCVTRWSDDMASDPRASAVLDELAAAGVGFLGLHRSSPLSLGAWRPLLGRLRGGTDVLHAHKFGSNAWAAVLGSLARTPVVVAHEHTWSFEGQPLRRLLDRELIARRSSAFVAVSGEDRRRMIEVEGIDPERIVLIPNGIPDPPGPGDRDLRAELGIGPEQPVIGTVGTLRPQKALHVLISAAAALRPEFPDLRVLIVGDGAERARLEDLRAELRLQDTVTLLGQRSDVPDLLRAFDVAVSSSDFEGAPLAILEYMAAGLPVVATRVGGVPDLVDQGRTGLLVEARRPGDLATALAQLLRDPDRARQMGERGRRLQRRQFTIEAVVDRVQGLYEQLWESSSGGSRAGSKGRRR